MRIDISKKYFIHDDLSNKKIMNIYINEAYC